MVLPRGKACLYGYLSITTSLRAYFLKKTKYDITEKHELGFRRGEDTDLWPFCDFRCHGCLTACGFCCDFAALPHVWTSTAVTAWGCHELNCVLTKDAEVLTPRTVKVTLFGNRAFADDQIKMVMISVLIKGEMYTQRHMDTGRMPCEDCTDFATKSANCKKLARGTNAHSP